MLALSLILLTVTGDVGVPRAARLLDAPTVLAQGSPPLVPSATVSDGQVSAAQLQVDIDGLKRQRPGLGGAITLIAVGGSLSLVGALYLVMGASSGGFVSALGSLMFVGLASVGIGVPMTILGVWMTVNRLAERAAIDDELKRLKLQLDEARLRGPPAYRPPTSGGAPQVELGRDDGLLLARF
jgi:hypothetical protein